jgi:hypothetical protein
MVVGVVPPPRVGVMLVVPPRVQLWRRNICGNHVRMVVVVVVGVVVPPPGIPPGYGFKV